MSVAKKNKKPEQAGNISGPISSRGVFPGPTDPQSRLRVDKVAAEQLREKIQSRILENPKAQKKAALLISMWIAGNTQPKKIQPKK
ncbi:MAG: hypothetical protein ACXWQO_08095 [Bdellovibrionota bacterium]